MDSNKFNNYYENLEWTTNSGNAIHGFIHGNRIKMGGVMHGKCKLSEQDILQIKSKCNEGTSTQKDIAKQFGIKQAQVSRINTGARWSHI